MSRRNTRKRRISFILRFMDKRLFHAAATLGLIIFAPFLLMAVVPEGVELPALFLETMLMLASLLAFRVFLPSVPPGKKPKRRRR